MDMIQDNVRGPQSRYTDAHIIVALDVLNERGQTGRKALACRTGLGEGSIKGMLKVLKDWKWVEITHRGITLTDFGRKNYLDFGIRFVKFHDDKYAVGTYQQGAIVEGVADKVTNGMAQRDDAVRNGASGASVFLMSNGHVIFPKAWNLDENDPLFADRVRATGIREGDVLIVVGAESPDVARVVAAAVGLDMK